MYIRKAETGDIGMLQGIARRVIRNNYTPFLGQKSVSHYIESGQSDKEIVDGMDDCCVLLQGDTILGFAIYMDDLLHLIMIDAPYQGKRFGSVLLTNVEQTMFNEYSVIRLQTFEDNATAIRFYEDNGWAIEKKESVEGLGIKMLHMMKRRPNHDP